MPKIDTDPHGKQLRRFADFSEDALAADDMEELLDTAVRNVADGLQSEFAKILVPQPEGDLLVVAGVGWNDGVVGNARIPGDIGSPPGYALKTGNPVRSNDLQAEERFEAPQLLLDHGVHSAINVIIHGDGAPFGVLEVDAVDVREYTPDDTAFLQSYAQLLSAAVVRVRQTEELQKESDDNEILLKELHHRISNDFQLVYSLINFRMSQIGEAAGRSELQWVSTRMRSLIQLHAQLRSGNSSTSVNLANYLRALGVDLFAVHEFTSRNITLDMQVQPWTVTARDAVSVGLILNEFVTNSVEHAFNESGGTISVALVPGKDGATLTLVDSGPGFQVPDRSVRSGMGLMETLAKTVSSTVTRDTEKGMRLVMTLNPEAEN